MSTEAISFYLSSRYGSGTFSLYYDFADYHGDYILSTGDEGYSPNTMHSGEIFGDVTAFKETKPGSGAFNLSPGDNNYIKIEKILEDDNLIRGGGWTFLVSQEKVDNSCGTIFSNFAGEQFSTSGWEFGINNANQLYFKYQAAQAGEYAGQPYYDILTLNNTPAAKNYYSVTYAANQIELGSYNPTQDKWTTTSRRVNSNYIRNNKDWYIGKGEYDYVGYMDKFAFFNVPLKTSDLEGIINASYQDIEFNNGEEYLFISGGVTGYEFGPTGETGVLYTSGTLSGTVDFSGSGENIIREPLYGYVDSGSGYFERGETYTGSGRSDFAETGAFYYRTIASEDLYSAITGFNVYGSGFTGVSQTKVYEDIDITGVVWTGSGVVGELFESDENILINEGDTLLTGEGASGDFSYNPNTLSYRGERIDSSYVEYILGSNENVNFRANYGYSEITRRDSFFVENQFSEQGEDLNVFLNGVYQATGRLESGPPDPTNVIDPLSPAMSVEDGNYVLRKTTLDSAKEIFEVGDGVLYDEDLGEINGRLSVTDVSQYTDGTFPTLDIEVNNSVIFFNGQKIYEGVDWDDAGVGLGFLPTTEFTDLGMTGTFISRGKYSNDESIIEGGMGLYDLNNYYGDDFVVFINGIRAPREDFIYYSSGINLIDGRKNLIELPQRLLYNITSRNIFF